MILEPEAIFIKTSMKRKNNGFGIFMGIYKNNPHYSILTFTCAGDSADIVSSARSEITCTEVIDLSRQLNNISREIQRGRQEGDKTNQSDRIIKFSKVTVKIVTRLSVNGRNIGVNIFVYPTGEESDDLHMYTMLNSELIKFARNISNSATLKNAHEEEK